MFALHHIAVIGSSKDSIDFYEKLGFCPIERIDRGYDQIYYLEGNGVVLELYIDPSHPQRVTQPEALGLRHLGFTVSDLLGTIEKLGVSAENIRERNGVRYTFIKDPDDLPIELIESKE